LRSSFFESIVRALGRAGIGGTMRYFLQIAYFVMGIVQFFAIWDGLMYMLGIGSFFGFFLALFAAYIPLVGSILGMYGAMNVWEWGFLQSFVLFFWYLVLWAVFLGFSGLSAIRGR
jgi:hypothetical protein